MKKLKSTLVVFLCCFASVFGQKTDSTKVYKTNDYFLYFEQQINPSAILLPFFIDEKGLQTKINSFFKLSEGDYFSPFELSKGKGLFFNVLTLQKVRKWYLKGAFEYSNSFFDKSRILLSDYASLINSPLFLFQQKSATFNIQDYHFKTTVSRLFFDEKINLALRFNYLGRSLYRRSDIRNNQQSLKLKSALGVAYNLHKNIIIGADFGLDYRKTEPNLSKKYTHQIDDTAYKHFMSIGFGTVDYAPNYKYKVINLIPIITFTLSQKKENIEKIIRLSVKNEKEEWTDLKIKKTILNNKPFFYDALTLEGDLFLRIKTNKRTYITKMQGTYKKGKTFRKISNQGSKTLSGIQQYLKIKTGVSFLPNKSSFVKKIGFDFSVFSHQMKDLNYMSSMQLGQFNISSDVDFLYSATKNLSLGLYLQGVFSSNFENKKNKGILNNTAFYHSVYVPYADYYGNSYYEFVGRCYLNYKKQLISTLFVETNYQKPLKKLKGNNYFYAVKFGITILI